MDNKTWLWWKKSSEKTIVATNKFAISVKGNDDETQKLPMGNEVGPVRPVRNLNEKLASVLLDSHAKVDLAMKQEKLAQEAIAGQEKAAAEAVCLKIDLEAANERITLSDVALKQCMQQLSCFQEEGEQKIHDAVMKASSEFEKVQKILEQKLMETSKNLADLAIENTNLIKALLVKENLVEELDKRTAQTVAEFNALMARLDSTEKENAFLKYEFHMLEKELQVRNEELDYYRQSADTSHRQHLESVKKVTKLESECQRLRLLVRKRLPGPANLVKMKGEVEIMRRVPTDLRRKPNPARDLILRDTSMEKSPEFPVENMNFLIDQLRSMEEENKNLKATMTKKNAELQSSRIMFSRTASRLSEVEAQLIELSGGQKSMELAKCSSVSNDSPIAGFDIRSNDGVSFSGSWANALISELEHFRDGKVKSPSECKTSDISDISLMDDFVEMEKLAMVSVQTPSEGRNHPPSSGKELVPIEQGHSSHSSKKEETHSRDIASDKSFDWLQDVLNAIFKQQHLSKRSLTELLEDIKIALGFMHHTNAHETDISRYITRKSPNASAISGSLNEDSCIVTSVKEKSKQCSQSNLNKSVCKIIGLIEGINPTPSVCNDIPDNGSKRDQCSSPLGTPGGDYFVHVFQWRSSELSDVLLQFVDTCNGLLSRKGGLDNFVEEVSFALDWILSNNVTPKGSSSTRDKIKKHFGWNESKFENEDGADANHQVLEFNAFHMSTEHSLSLHSVASSHDQNISFQKDHSQYNLQEENKRLKDELDSMESAKKDIEATLQSATDEIKALVMRIQESEQSIKSLQAELEALKESKGLVEDQIENQKSINEDLDTQLTVSKAKMNEVLQKLSSLEIELEDKSSCCEELEATCLELQLQLESIAKKETLNCYIDEEGKLPRNGWEITAASVKLAECQETILNLGKQLKALASPREAALFDRVFTATSASSLATSNKHLNKHFSLRDQMLAEDNAKAIILRSPAEDSEKPTLNHSNNGDTLSSTNVLVCTPEAYVGSKHKAGNPAVGTLAIVPSQKQGGVGLLRRLLMRRKRGCSKKSKSLLKV